MKVFEEYSLYNIPCIGLIDDIQLDPLPLDPEASKRCSSKKTEEILLKSS